MQHPSIVAIGAATQDVFLRGKIFTAHREKGELVEAFVVGSKNEVDGVHFTTGGGATNAAVTFARHGFHSSFMGRLGKDVAGQAVLQELVHDHINHDLIHYTDEATTGYSVLLLAPNGERTILTHRGASGRFGINSASLRSTKPDWFYISSLSGDFPSLQAIIKYAHKHHIKVAINPGKGELMQSREFHELLPDISLLSVNKEEAQKLFHGETCEELARHAVKHVSYVIITDGAHGSVASDGHKLYRAGMYDDVPVIDRTGAGDAFSSGFTASIAAGQSMERAIVFASANSTSVVGQIGAKPGILTQAAPLHHMPLVIHPLA